MVAPKTLLPAAELPPGSDFDLHGLVGIRLVNASPGDVAAVARQIGPMGAPLAREPDIVIRFVDRLRTSARMRFLGVDEVGFTDDAFLVLRGRYQSRARVQIPFERIGGRCEIMCESGLPAVPLLIPIINLTALARGAIPVPASAFEYRGAGTLVMGWSKGGKTGTLLAFMARGARYIGEEWVYVTPNGRMYGLPHPIRVRDWHLAALPQLRQRVPGSSRLRLRALRLGASLARVVPGSMVRRRVTAALQRQAFADVPAAQLFGGPLGSLDGTLDRVLFTVSHDAPQVVVRQIDAGDVARRMVFAQLHERLDFMAYYLKFRFAFPGAANELIERAEALQRERLGALLAGKEVYAVLHPYPVPLDTLCRAVAPLL